MKRTKLQHCRNNHGPRALAFATEEALLLIFMFRLAFRRLAEPDLNKTQ